jgi:hypothetical protein
MAAVGGSLMLTDLLIAHTALADPYSWTMTQNMLFFGLTRTTYSFGGMLIAFSMFFGSFNFGKEVLLRPFFMMGGSLCLVSALITPLMLSLNFNSAPDGFFVTFYVVIAVGLANIFVITLISLLLYMLLQYPIEKVLGGFVKRYLSQDKLLEAHYGFDEARKAALVA